MMVPSSCCQSIGDLCDKAHLSICPPYGHWTIENVISDTIDSFHMDAFSATAPMNIHVDVHLRQLPVRSTDSSGFEPENDGLSRELVACFGF